MYGHKGPLYQIGDLLCVTGQNVLQPVQSFSMLYQI